MPEWDRLDQRVHPTARECWCIDELLDVGLSKLLPLTSEGNGLLEQNSWERPLNLCRTLRTVFLHHRSLFFLPSPTT